jgi:CHAD domain-containing protein
MSAKHARKKPASRPTAEAAFEYLARPLVSDALSCAAALDTNSDAEVLHKLRVSLRRLRTLWWAYKPILDADFDANQRDLYRSLASAAGNTRDWDILIKLVQAFSDAELLQALHRERDQTSDSSRELLSHAGIGQVLQDALQEGKRELEANEVSILEKIRELSPQKISEAVERADSDREKSIAIRLLQLSRRAKGQQEGALSHRVFRSRDKEKATQRIEGLEDVAEALWHAQRRRCQPAVASGSSDVTAPTRIATLSAQAGEGTQTAAQGGFETSLTIETALATEAVAK